MNKKNDNINKEWHKSHNLRKKASLEQQIVWHLDHREHCSCLENMPEEIVKLMEQHKIKMPKSYKKIELNQDGNLG